MLNSQTTALSKITTDLNNLQQTSFALGDPLGALNALTTTSSNSGVVTATAASSALAGTHNVTVSGPPVLIIVAGPASSICQSKSLLKKAWVSARSRQPISKWTTGLGMLNPFLMAGHDFHSLGVSEFKIC